MGDGLEDYLSPRNWILYSQGIENRNHLSYCRPLIIRNSFHLFSFKLEKCSP